MTPIAYQEFADQSVEKEKFRRAINAQVMPVPALMAPQYFDTVCQAESMLQDRVPEQYSRERDFARLDRRAHPPYQIRRLQYPRSRAPDFL